MLTQASLSNSESFDPFNSEAIARCEHPRFAGVPRRGRASGLSPAGHGWNDAQGAWIIKNSWGTSWGETAGYGAERGYMRIAYGSNSKQDFHLITDA